MLSSALLQQNIILTPSQRKNGQRERGSISSRTSPQEKRRSRSTCGSLHYNLLLIARQGWDYSVVFEYFQLDLPVWSG